MNYHLKHCLKRVSSFLSQTQYDRTFNSVVL